MNEMVTFLAKHGYGLLFVSVLGRQACLPIPANLLLLAAGALAGLGRMNFVGIIAVSVIAFLLADLTWYQAGRRWGCRTLHFVCGSARDPGACVSKVSGTFNRRGVKSLLISKFVIGLDAVAAPMSGISRISRSQFLAFDALGAIFWSSTYAALGYVFSDQLDRVATYSANVGKLAVLAGIAAVGVFIVLKLVRWYRFLREFRLARITPDQLWAKLSAGEKVMLLDLQGGTKHFEQLQGIPGAVRIDPHQMRRYRREYRDIDFVTSREIVLYCSSPGEFTAARVALDLRRKGFEHVRPLAGGLQAWHSRGLPLTPSVQMLPAPENAIYVLREVLQFSEKNTAQLLKTSGANVDQLLKRAQERISGADLLGHGCRGESALE